MAFDLISRMNRPEPIERSDKERKRLASEVNRLRVYDYAGCPETLDLRNTLHYLNLDIQYCDIRKCQVHRDDLLHEYGRLHAPCLRIQGKDSVQWLDEQEQIIHYLKQRFDPDYIQEPQAA